MHAFDKQTDKRTDRQTPFSSLVCASIPCSAEKNCFIVPEAPAVKFTFRQSRKSVQIFQ